MQSTAAVLARKPVIRFNEKGAHHWIRTQGPCNWHNKIQVETISVPLGDLEHAGSWTDPGAVNQWLSRMKAGRTVPLPVVCRTERGTFYLRDGNHRYLAMQELFAGSKSAQVRVALVVPKAGFHFRYRWFGTYGTYLLEPLKRRSPQHPTKSVRPQRESLPFTGKTLVLVAHPDDETGGCAGLLQRLRNPAVAYATDGAPQDPFFWAAFESPQAYGLQRRREAAAALAAAGVSDFEFLSCPSDATRNGFQDQQLHRSLPQLFEAVHRLIRRYRPQTVLVPAYEGGHPDHDSCSLLGSMIRTELGIPVWEMPLYHRTADGELACQRFREMNGSETVLALTSRELQVRAAMVASYRSQWDLDSYISSPIEYFREQPEYDYGAPPHSGKVNYEVWQWPMRASEVCQSFQDCLTEYTGRKSSDQAVWPANLHYRNEAAIQ